VTAEPKASPGPGPIHGVDNVNIDFEVDGVNILLHPVRMTEPNGKYHHGDLRAALLSEAAAMITVTGVEGLTMRALGDRLGVSRAAAYRHFSGKAALLVAVAATGFERLRARLEEVQAGAPKSSVGRFGKMGEEYVRFAIENPAHYRLMYGREALTREGEPELRRPADALFDYLVEVIQAYQRAGEIKRTDPKIQAFVAWSAVHGLASLVIEGQIRDPGDVDALIKQTTRTLLDGMGANP
jgi:AcrR family transcriptional regulator